MNNVKAIQRITETELRYGAGSKKSWHDMYSGSAYVFLGGLNYDLSEGDVLAVFSQYGEIVNINLVRDKKTGKSKGFCFLCYENQKSTILAVDNLNGIKLCGKTVRVDHVTEYRRPKDEHGNEIIEKGCAPKTPTPSPEPSESESEEEAPKIKKKKSKKTKDKKKRKKHKERREAATSDSEHDGFSTQKTVSTEKTVQKRIRDDVKDSRRTSPRQGDKVKDSKKAAHEDRRESRRKDEDRRRRYESDRDPSPVHRHREKKGYRERSRSRSRDRRA